MGGLLNAASTQKIRKRIFCQPRTVTAYLPPGGFGIRVDSCLYPGYTVPSQYDSLLGKLIAWGETKPCHRADEREPWRNLSLKEYRPPSPFTWKYWIMLFIAKEKYIPTLSKEEWAIKPGLISGFPGFSVFAGS